jgi:16S rRNA (adenine1518-N6/adenine1519-N6)-dimethyltransferase
MKNGALYQIKASLHQFNLRAKKGLGQHFLVDEDVLQCIISTAELNHEDIVIEVGPGLGVLTKRLAEQAATVIAVELDSRLVSILRKILSPFPNVKIIHADILKIAPQQLLENYSAFPERTRGYKVVANLPYYITSPVLRHFLQAYAKPSLMVVMVQKEVGEAIAATPGNMSLLSIITQFYARPTIVSYVPAKSFYPSPKVDSVILQLDVYPKPAIEVSDLDSFFGIVNCGFSSPRKQLRNSLSQALGIPASRIALSLEKAEIEAKRRAETLSLEEWKKLWEVLAPLKG